MEKWIECVPNISEGNDLKIIDAIRGALDRFPDIFLLSIDSGRSANRTVLTLVGKKDSMVGALLKIYELVYRLIDMRQHTGVHPRIGAVDVCPFIPLQGSTLKDCVELSHELGSKLGEKLAISGYYYEAAAIREERKNLANCRSGEYEGIPLKLNQPNWRPDFGPIKFNQKQGLTLIGARKFLIAFNINLETRSVEIAKKISTLIRTSGISPSAYRLPALKAIGWEIPEFNRVQVSTNIIDFSKNSLFQVWKVVTEIAKQFDTRATGSELIGLVPRIAFINSGREFSVEQNQPLVDEEDLVDLTIKKLNLDEFSSFSKVERILEYSLQSRVKNGLKIPLFAKTTLLKVKE